MFIDECLQITPVISHITPMGVGSDWLILARPLKINPFRGLNGNGKNTIKGKLEEK